MTQTKPFITLPTAGTVCHTTSWGVKRTISSLLLGIHLMANTGCYNYMDVPKYIDVSTYGPKMSQRRVPRIVAMTLFTNMSRQPGIEVEFLDKLHHTLGNSGFRVYTPLILKMPKEEVHEDNKLTIVSEYYNYPESLRSILAKEIHWVATGYIQDGGAKDVYIVTVTASTPNGGVHMSTFRTAQQGSLNAIVTKVAERFMEEDKKDPKAPMETYDTGEKVVVGTEKRQSGTETISEFDFGKTLLLVAGVVVGVLTVTAAVVSKR